MRGKHSVKATNVTCSDISVAKEVVNGLHRNNSTKVVSKSVNKSEVEETWSAMDYENFFMHRKNGIAKENDSNTTNVWTPSIEDVLQSESSSSQNLTPPGYVFKFYNSIARDYWNVLPKTDFTYSPASKHYTKQIAPGVPVVPNLSRRTFHADSDSSKSSEYSKGTITDECSTSEERKHPSTSRISKKYSDVRGRNACRKLLEESSWIKKNSWIRRTFETIRTVIVTSVTTSVTTTTETVMHPLKKPYITLPFILFLFAILFYVFLYNEKEVEEEVTETVPWMPLAWIQTPLTNSSRLANVYAVLAKPFNWAYKVAGACLDFVINWLFMIPTILYELAVSLCTISYIFLQRIAGWGIQNPAIGVLDSGSGKSTLIDSEEIRRIVIEILSLQLQEGKEDFNGLKRSGNEEVMVFNQFMLKVNERLSSLENLSKDQRKSVNEIFSRLKLLEEGLSIKYHSTQNADTSLVDWSEVSDNVAHLVKNMLQQYHADRTGMPDYALRSNGGAIISVRCTQTYTRDSGTMYLFGLPIWTMSNSPEVIIKPGIMPGECWPFEGAEGYVAIKLAMPIYINGFTLEHTPKELSPHRNIESAPNQFSVWALKEISDENPEFLGRFKFLDNGESLQYFDAEKLDVPVQMVELRIESNHGSINYTCLYRFRVHGVPAI